jgi:hypothetical protein
MIGTELPGGKKQETAQKTRAYVLLQSLEDNHSEVVKKLRRQAGVVAVDLVEGPPDIVLVIEATDRQQLASVLMNALSSVQDVTEGLELFPTRTSQKFTSRL